MSPKMPQWGSPSVVVAVVVAAALLDVGVVAVPDPINPTNIHPGVRITASGGTTQRDNAVAVYQGFTDTDPARTFTGLTCTCLRCTGGMALTVDANGFCFCNNFAMVSSNFVVAGGSTFAFVPAGAATNLFIDFKTSANYDRTQRSVDMRCQATNDAGANTGFFEFNVEVNPWLNSNPTASNTRINVRVSEDNSNTPAILAAPLCQNAPNVRLTAGPAWELQGTTPAGGQGDRIAPMATCALVAGQTTCASSTGECITFNANQAVTSATATNFALNYCIVPDAVGVVTVDCTFADLGTHCCQAGSQQGNPAKCPNDLVARCNNAAQGAAPGNVVVRYTVTLEEVNDPPVGYFDLAAMPSMAGPHVWQEDCGLSGYTESCLTAGAVVPQFQWSPLLFANMNCPNGLGDIVTRNGVTMYNMCTGGGTMNALPNNGLQGHSTAVSENVAAGVGGAQTWRMVCNTDRDNLFHNSQPGGCPGCGGRVPCGCPDLGAFPFNAGLRYIPEMHAVGRATVVCYLEDINPNPPGTVVDAGRGNRMGGTTAAEGGVRRRLLVQFNVEITEVNDPPAIDLDPTVVATPAALAGSTDPVDKLPRVLFRQDPSWTGPSEPVWPNNVNPDPDACTIVDCCAENDLSSVVTVTGKEPNPANVPGATGSIRIQDCPANRRQKCCVINNVWMGAVWQVDAARILNCPNRVQTPAGCLAAPSGCSWVNNACVYRGYGNPATTDGVTIGTVSALPGPLSEQGPFNGDQFMWDQQWNVKCRVKCEANKKPLSFHGPGECEDTMFEGAVTPHTLSSPCYDMGTHTICPANIWPLSRSQSHQLVFRASSQTAFGHRYKRGSVRVQCTMVDEYMPDGSVDCTPPTAIDGSAATGQNAQGNFGRYISGCKDTAGFAANCWNTGAPGIAQNGLPCPSREVQDNLKRLPDPIEFIIEFTAPNYTLSDYPSANGYFDNVKNPWWEVQIGEDSQLREVTAFLKNPVAWANGAAIENMQGTVTSVTHDPALFKTSGEPKIANLLPPDSGDLIFQLEQDMSGHSWVVIGLRDNGGGDPSKANGPAYEEFIFWVQEINDPPIAVLDPKVAPSARINIDEDTLIRTGGHTFLLYPDLAPGPQREIDPMPAAGSAQCPLTNTFPGCGVIPITAAAAVAVKYDTAKRPLCGASCGTGAGCGCGQQLQVDCSTDHPEYFDVQPTVDANGGVRPKGTLHFQLKPDASGDAQVTCSIKDCVDPGVGIQCTKTTDGKDALTTVSKFTIAIKDINDPPTIELTSSTLQIIVDEDSPTHTATILRNVAPGPLSELLSQNVEVKCTVKQGQTQLFQGPIITELSGNPRAPQLGSITFTPAKDASGVASVNCQASDDGVPKITTNAPPFEIIIREINDEPSGTLVAAKVTVPEDSGTYSVKQIVDLIPGPPSEQQVPQQLTIVCSSNTPGLFVGVPEIDAAGTLTFTPQPNAVGNSVVSCTFTDDGVPPKSWSTTFEIEVTEVNDPPLVTVNGVMMSPTITVSEDRGRVEESNFLTGLAPGPPSEEMSQSYSFACGVDQPELFSQQPQVITVGTTGTVLFHTAQDMSGRTTCTCVMTDTGNPVMSTSFSFEIVIEEVNDEPIAVVTENPVRVNEDEPPVSRPGFLNPYAPGPPAEAGQGVATVCTTDTSYFLVPPRIEGGGSLFFTVAKDKSGTVAVTCTVTDAGSPPMNTGISFNIEIAEVNDPPIVLQAQTIVRVNEDSGAYNRQQWSQLAPGPIDEVLALQTFSYTCSSTNDALFVAGKTPQVIRTGSTAMLSFQAGPDQAGSSTVSCTLTDTGIPAASTDVEFVIEVADINDKPTASCALCDSTTGISVKEDSPLYVGNNFITLVSAGPVSEASQVLTASCTASGPATLWYKDTTVSPPVDGSPKLDPTTGTLIFQPAPDTSGSSTVSCRLTDDGSPQGVLVLKSFPITVEEVNDPPTGVLDKSGRASVAVGTGTTTIRSWITSISPGPPQESGQTVTISCVPDNPALFAPNGQPAVDRTTGTLTFTPATDSSEGSSTVKCTLKDNGTPPETLTISFVVAFENQPPTAVAVSPTVVVAEESGPYQKVSFLTNLAAGPQVEVAKGQSIATVVCQPAVTSLFSVAPVISTEGTLEFTPAVDAAGSTVVDCIVSDNGKPQRSVGVNFTINVTEVNDPPRVTVNQMSVTAPEGGDKVTVPSFVTVSPGPASESAQTVSGSCLPQDSSMLQGGVLLNLNGWTLQRPDGVLEFTPAAQKSGRTLVDCTVSDTGVPAQTTTFQFELIVSETNNPPTGTLTRIEVTVDEDTPLFEVTSMLTGLAPGPQAEIDAGQTVSVSCLPENAALFTLAGRPKINQAGTLSLIPAPDAVGSTSVACTLQDSGTPAMSVVRSFTVNVIEKNDKPIAVVTRMSVAVAEDAGASVFPGFVSPLSAGPASESGQTIKTTCFPDTASLFATSVSIASFGAKTGELSFTPAPDAVGSTAVTCEVVDSNTGVEPAQSTSFSFNIEIQEVNDPPSGLLKLQEITAMEDVGVFTSRAFLYQVSPGPASEASQVVTTSCVAGNSLLFSVQPAISQAGDLSFSPAPDASGSTDVTCNLVDNGAPAQSTQLAFKITLIDTNDPPTGTLSQAKISVQEDSGPVEVVDFITGMAPGPATESGQKFTTTCLADNPGMFQTLPSVAQQSPTVGKLLFTPALNAVGSSQVVCTIADSVVPPGETKLSFTIDMAGANDAPVVTIPDANRKVPVTQEVVQKPYTFPGFLQVSPGPGASEAAQGVTSQCIATNPQLFVVQPTVELVNGIGNLSFVAREGLSAANALTSLVSCTFTDTGSPARATTQTFEIDFQLPSSPAGLDIYYSSPEYVDSPAGKYNSPVEQFRRSPEYANSPLADIDTPQAKWLGTPEGKDSPEYKDFLTVPENPANILRIRLKMIMTQFRLSVFRSVMQEVFTSVITSLRVYWVCPITACPTAALACPTRSDDRLNAGCKHGDDYSGTAHLADILQESTVDLGEETVVDFDMQTQEQADMASTDMQRLQTLQASLAGEAVKTNSPAVSRLGLQESVVAPCSDCGPLNQGGGDDFGEWWHWLLIGLGALLFLCLLVLLIWLCCCRKKEKDVVKEEHHDMQHKQVYMGESTATTSSMYHPEAPAAGRLGTSGGTSDEFDSLYSRENRSDVQENPIAALYPPPPPPPVSDTYRGDNEWRPYTVDWGDAGHNDPRPEAQY